MRIAITADPEITVPPLHYGGIERIVDMLVHGLLERGHDVTLFAHRESKAACPLVPWGGASSLSWKDTLMNAATLTRAVAAADFDVLHSFSRVAYMLPILPMPIPKLMTYQRAISRRSITLAHTLSLGSLQFSAISDWMMKSVKDVGSWHLVPNGVRLDMYDFQPSVPEDAALVFLGRIEEIKGPHIAIDVARRSNLPLIIAGNIPREHKGWFDAMVAPHIDGRNVHYVGPVNDEQKNELLGRAQALLMPILWEEPFGIVMAEAMACGTPVIGLRRGAVPEVVSHGETGFAVRTTNELVEAVGCIGDIDRRHVRERCETLYSADRICEQYLEIYSRIMT